MRAKIISDKDNILEAKGFQLNDIIDVIFIARDTNSEPFDVYIEVEKDKLARIDQKGFLYIPQGEHLHATMLTEDEYELLS